MLTPEQVAELPRRCRRIYPLHGGMYRACRRREGHVPARAHAWDPPQHDNLVRYP